jgi:hypothetical protein
MSRLMALGKSGGGPPQSRTLPRIPLAHEWRGASWSAPAPWRFWSKANQKADELMLRTAVSKNPAEIVELLFVK